MCSLLIFLHVGPVKASASWAAHLHLILLYMLRHFVYRYSFDVDTMFDVDVDANKPVSVSVTVMRFQFCGLAVWAVWWRIATPWRSLMLKTALLVMTV